MSEGAGLNPNKVPKLCMVGSRVVGAMNPRALRRQGGASRRLAGEQEVVPVFHLIHKVAQDDFESRLVEARERVPAEHDEFIAAGVEGDKGVVEAAGKKIGAETVAQHGRAGGGRNRSDHAAEDAAGAFFVLILNIDRPATVENEPIQTGPIGDQRAEPVVFAERTEQFCQIHEGKIPGRAKISRPAASWPLAGLSTLSATT